jgi:competence protein ComEC
MSQAAKLTVVLFCALLLLTGCKSAIAASPSSSTASAVVSSTTSPSTSLPGSPSTVTNGPKISPSTTATSSPSGLLQVHFIDVSQGDSVLIITPEGKVALIDGGESGSGALEYLRSVGIDHIDLMVATHPHSDHIGGLVDVLQALPVTEVVTNGQPHTTSVYEHFLDAIAAAKATYTEVTRGDTLKLGSLTFDVLHPVSPTGDDLNSQSVVLRLAYGKVSFLFTGDAGKEAEADMLASGANVQAQVLKVGHHGSSSASSASFLAAVGPEAAIYGCGVGNSYGHPHAETITALEDVETKIYGTDKDSTIVVTSDGSTYSVDGATIQPRAPPSTVEQTQPPASGSLAISVVSLTSPVSPGSTAKLTVKTSPAAACSIEVHYKSGPSHAAGLGEQTASDEGLVTWRWKVGTSTTPGTWRIVVSAAANGEKTSIQVPLEVR